MQYILILFWLYIMAIAGHTPGMHHKEMVLGKEARRAKKQYAWLVMLPVIAFAAFRWNYFGDTNMYIRTFQSIPATLSGKLEYVKGLEKDVGFYSLGALVSVFSGQRFRVFFIIIALIQGYCLMKTFRKYSDDYWMAVFFFVASTDVYSWMFNGVRQFTAVAIIFGASTWIFQKKYVKACLMIAFASLFHQSALLMIPIVFVVQGKPWNWKTLLVILGTIVIMNFSGAFTGMLDTALEDTQYRNVVSDWTQGGDDGTNPIRVLVYSVPTLLSLLCRKKIAQSGDRVIQICCNMSIMSTALYLVSMVTSGIFMGRLPIYCSLYGMGILLPWELKHVFGKSVKLMAIVCFLLFYFYQMHFAWGVL